MRDIEPGQVGPARCPLFQHSKQAVLNLGGAGIGRVRQR